MLFEVVSEVIVLFLYLFQPFKNSNTMKNKPVCEVAVDIFHEYLLHCTFKQCSLLALF